MMDCPKVSVIVPVYKKEYSIEKCVKSIVAQDYENIEIILVNDGSPDRCGEIIDEMAKHYNFIKVINQKNSGVSVARSEGVKYAEGKYICFVDADDYLMKNYVSTLVKEMDDDIDMVASSAKENCNQEKYYTTKTGAVKKMFTDDCFGVCVWGKLFRKNIIPTDAFPKGIKMGEDMFALFKIVNKCRKVKFIPYNGYLYTEDAIESSFEYSDISDYFKVIDLIDDMKNYLVNNSSDVDKFLEIGKVRRYLGLFNIMERKNGRTENYSNKCFTEIKNFRKMYGYCKELSWNFNVRIFLAAYFPKIYLKIVKVMMNK